ncbi:MAG: hypothetical protein QOE70_5867 [Chthoniobacter sp.]|jgi:Ca2+-binding EF-hand superfamily protein|nr:hypothetical protein [Chthoniobacter sp.]
MKKLHLLSLGACFLALLVPTTSFAGKKGDKSENKEARPRQLLKQYDTDSNGEIDGKERDALRTAFGSNAALKKLDTNGDGKLDDTEIASIKAKKKGEGKAGKNKKPAV